MNGFLLLKLCRVWDQCLVLFLLESIPHSLGCSSFEFLCVLFWWVSKDDSAAFPAFCCCLVFVPFYMWIRADFFKFLRIKTRHISGLFNLKGICQIHVYHSSFSFNIISLGEISPNNPFISLVIVNHFLCEILSRCHSDRTNTLWLMWLL